MQYCLTEIKEWPLCIIPEAILPFGRTQNKKIFRHISSCSVQLPLGKKAQCTWSNSNQDWSNLLVY